MTKYGIFYGSETGTTANVAQRIAKVLNVNDADVHDVADVSPSALANYDVLLMGTSTWGDGEIQSSWYDFLDGAQALDLKGKKMAVFGCGDEAMTETFCNGVDYLYKRMIKTGVQPIAQFSTIPLDFHHSDAVSGNDIAEGLLLDEVNKPELTDARIADWVEVIRKAVG